MQKRKVSEIMSSGVTTVHVQQSARQAQHLMRKNGFHGLPVVGNKGELLGIVTSSDLIREHDPDASVAQFMTTGVLTVDPDTRIEDAARLMRENEMHHLVVLDDNKMVGILSTFDLLYLMENAEIPRRHALAEADPEV